MRYTDVSITEITEATIGYYFPADNPGAATMEKLDPRNLVSDRIKRIEIGTWNMYTTALSEVSVSAYSGRIKGYFIPLIFDDDYISSGGVSGYAYSANAIWDAYIMNDTNEVAKINGSLTAANGSTVTPIAHGFIDSTGIRGSCSITQAYVAGLDFTIAKVGEKFTYTFTTPTGIDNTNAIVIINPFPSGSPQLEEHYVISNGFEVDFSSAVSFFYTVLYSEAALPSTPQHGSHTHGTASVQLRANTNLQVFSVLSRYDPANNKIQLTHNFHEQLETGSTSFGGITKTLNANSLTKFRNSGNRGNIYLFLDFPANPY
jgi:hypothetical protein